MDAQFAEDNAGERQAVPARQLVIDHKPAAVTSVVYQEAERGEGGGGSCSWFLQYPGVQSSHD